MTQLFNMEFYGSWLRLMCFFFTFYQPWSFFSVFKSWASLRLNQIRASRGIKTMPCNTTLMKLPCSQPFRLCFSCIFRQWYFKYILMRWSLSKTSTSLPFHLFVASLDLVNVANSCLIEINMVRLISLAIKHLDFLHLFSVLE